MVGCVQVPLGIAGPLRINKQEYWLPLATTEGALVASVNRGCKAILKSKGSEALVKNAGVTRGPVFKVKGLKEGKKLIEWLEKNKALIKKTASKGEKHLKLLSIKQKILIDKI